MGKIKVVIINRNKEGDLDIKEKVIDDTLETYHEILSCDKIDILTRKIYGNKVCFVIDDEQEKYAPKQDPIAIYVGGAEVIHGTLIITGKSDDLGNLSSLDDSQIALIKESIGDFGYSWEPEVYYRLNISYKALAYSGYSLDLNDF